MIGIFVYMVQEVTTTLKVHLLTSDSDKEALAEVSEAYRAACDHVSDYVFKSGDEKVLSLHKLFYRELRDRFGLKSQFAESVLKTVVAKYATVRSNGQPHTRIRFRAPQCDLVRGRDWSYTQGILSVNTLNGRLRLPFFGQFDFTDSGCRFGGARLLFDRCKDRYVTVCWSYYDLEQKLTYKARLAGQDILKVSPDYTSQRCPVCGSIDKHSRDKKNHHYLCTKCGYRSDDDRIGAMNLYQLGLEYLNGTDAPKIQSPSGKPGGGGRSQPSRDVTSRRKVTKGGSYVSKRNAYTTGESQAHRL